MSGIRHVRWLSVLTGLAEHCWQPPPAGPPANGAKTSTGAGMCPVVGARSFRRIVDIPFAAWVAALDRWQLTAPGSELRLGQSLLRGPAGHDQHFGTCRIQVRLARGPLRPPLRMRLDIDRWSATSTALELIPCQRIRPTAAYFRAGHALLDSLTHAVPQHSPARHLGGGTARQPLTVQGEARAGVPGGAAAGSAGSARRTRASMQASANDRSEMPAPQAGLGGGQAMFP